VTYLFLGFIICLTLSGGTLKLNIALLPIYRFNSCRTFFLISISNSFLKSSMLLNTLIFSSFLLLTTIFVFKSKINLINSLSITPFKEFINLITIISNSFINFSFYFYSNFNIVFFTFCKNTF